MSLLSHAGDHPTPAPPGPGRGPLLIAASLVAAALGGGAYWLLRPPAPSTPEPASAPARAATPPAEAGTGTLRVSADVSGAVVHLDGERLGLAPQRAAGLEPGRHRVRVERFGHRPFEQDVDVRAGAEARVAARLVPEAGRGDPATRGGGPALRVTSDVAGASVFLDREYLGQAPVTVTELAPGPHRVNVSAEGYEMYAESFEFEGSPWEIAVRFGEIRLDQSVAVRHRRAFGDRSGTLSASREGIRFQSENPKDSFAVGFDALERFEIDYLKDDLRVKIRGGRNYNFTSHSGDPDELFVFHKRVEEVRERLAR